MRSEYVRSADLSRAHTGLSIVAEGLLDMLARYITSLTRCWDHDPPSWERLPTQSPRR